MAETNNDFAPVKAYDWSNYDVQDNIVTTDQGTFLRNPNGTLTQIKAPQSAWSSGLQTGSQVVGALSSAMNAYTGWKGLELAEDQFDFTKKSTNRDIANKAKVINNEIGQANEVGLALGGGAMTAEQIAASRQAATARKVNGSAIS